MNTDNHNQQDTEAMMTCPGDEDEEAYEAYLEARLDAARAWEVPEYWGGCPTCGRQDVCLNVGRYHYFVCHAHKTRWCVGGNLFSFWRDETKDIWERNAALLETYTEVESLHNPISRSGQDACCRCGARDEILERHHPLCQHEDRTFTALPDFAVRALLEVGAGREVIKALLRAEPYSSHCRHCKTQGEWNLLRKARGNIR